MVDRTWALLAYRMPREPSGPRVTVWRKLRRLGAVQLVDGLVALPATAETTEALAWLAEDVTKAGGEAWTWQATGSKAQDRLLLQLLRDGVAADYAALAAEAAVAEPRNRVVERLRRSLRDLERRDYVAPRERDEARRAIRRLTQAAAAASLERSS